jgi:phage-related baseplate assembly protein
MAANIDKLYSLPDISVIDDINIENMKEEMISDYESIYLSETGESITLHPADKDRLKLNAVANKLFQAYQCIDRGFKMNFLKYAYGDYLKHLGAFKKTFKQDSKASVTTLRFSLQAARTQVTAIPQGKRATAGDNLFFATDDYAEIAAGQTYVDVAATCTALGVVGNGYVPGQINTMADTIAYVASVTNTTVSEGGSGEETDPDFRERIFLAPSSYSTAGPEDAYIYWVRQYNSAAIEDVTISTTEDAVVDIRLVLTNGDLPSSAFIADLTDYLNGSAIKPLTDKMTIAAPDVVNYALDFTYYIGRSNKDNIEAIQSAADEAKDAYVTWQKTHIGADINTDVLIEFLRATGVKRVVINSPGYIVVENTEIASATSVTMAYGGLEDD